MIKIHRDPKQELLRSVPLFEACSARELKDVAAIADELFLAPGRRLTTEGAQGQEFIVLASGSADVYKRGDKVASLGPGDFVGEIALLTGRTRTATVVVTEPALVLVVARHRFIELVDRLPGVRSRLEAALPLRQAS
ncbi:MAG: cyclic nucleotide-binding domain-containing protein [Marmoricola sp.]